jgi:hypothetical protein
LWLVKIQSSCHHIHAASKSLAACDRIRALGVRYVLALKAVHLCGVRILRGNIRAARMQFPATARRDFAAIDNIKLMFSLTCADIYSIGHAGCLWHAGSGTLVLALKISQRTQNILYYYV